MANGDLNWIANYIWSIADDVLRDLYVRGKYRDVILPMAVLRRLDAVLADGKQAVLDMKAALDDAGIVAQDTPLRGAAGQAFYNTSKFTLSDLRSRASPERLEADFRDYIDGFSPNVQDILDCFEFRNQIPRLSRADALGTLIEKFTSPDVNLSPEPVRNTDGSIRHPGLDNHGMGTIFEELVRRFNEDNNEEAGEHWTPRDAVKLMAQLVFQPIADEINSGTYLLYDGACGTGGMLTVAEETVQGIAAERGKAVSTHLYGQEINAETYAICKADLLLKGEGDAADNIVGGPEYSTLSNDAFPSHEFDFMLSNPPYGKSWKTDLERMGGKAGMRDPRFLIDHDDDPEYSLLTRSSDGQMLFLANKLSKMKTGTRLGSRIAEVHNGSSLFTGDAGQGESNIRRWIIENDWLEAIVALPANMFYNTGIATYIWVLTNRKPEHRRGKVQLIDATSRFRPLRRNLGKKNCELGEEDIAHICERFLEFSESDESKVFDNGAFGYWKVTVERPLRLKSQFTRNTWMKLQFASGDAELRANLYQEFSEKLFQDFAAIAVRIGEVLTEWSSDSDERPARKITDAQKKRLRNGDTWARDAQLVELAPALLDELGDSVWDDHNVFREALDGALKRLNVKLGVADKKAIYDATSWRSEDAAPVIKKVHRRDATPDPLHGLFAASVGGKIMVVEYEPDTELRDTEKVPLQEAGGIDDFIQREVLPYGPDAWYKPDKVKTGYEISFNRYFYRAEPMRTLDEIRADIVELEQETQGLLGEIIGYRPL